jgi:hypothetical protein
VIRRAALLAVALLCSGCAGDSDGQPAARYLVYTKAVGLPEEAVWIGDVDGRRMRRLTRGNYALVAADGRTIAIARGSRVHTVEPDGDREQLLGRGRPIAWFPDSRHLLVVRGDGVVNVDTDDGDATALIPKPALLRGWSVSPTGRLVYALARKDEPWGVCREELDIFVVDSDGDSRRRLTDDGRSSDPVWGNDRIAFARHPVDPNCAITSAGIWTMRADGDDVRAIVRRAPRRFAWNGYYGLRPYGFVNGLPVIVAGVLTEWGDELALVDTRTGRMRRPDLDPRPRYSAAMYIDHVSRDGRYALGAGCGAEFPCTIRIFSVLDGKARNLITGRVGSPHWNR